MCPSCCRRSGRQDCALSSRHKLLTELLAWRSRFLRLESLVEEFQSKVIKASCVSRHQQTPSVLSLLASVVDKPTLQGKYPLLTAEQAVTAPHNKMNDLNRSVCLTFIHYHNLRGVDKPMPLFRIANSSTRWGNPRFDALAARLTDDAGHLTDIAAFLNRNGWEVP